MFEKNILKRTFCGAVMSIGLTPVVNATIVEFETSQGNFQVNLFDQTTPKTVANFLNYIDEQHYANSIVHRVAPNFVVQGGGFTFDGDWPLTRIDTNTAVINEPVYSNVKGTIAMAKVDGNANSATDQWFFNLANNSSNLDEQNGGFTVFGQVIGDGIDVVNKIAAMQLCQDIPMTADYSSQNCSDRSMPGIENFAVINQITIIDSSVVTDANLTPAKNTLLTKEEVKADSSSSGVFSWLLVILIGLRLGKCTKR